MNAELAQFPEKLKPLFEPHRYKVLHGGRGGGKSWAIARALAILALQRKIRVLCARQTQRSIRDSVHKLFVDQIARLGLARCYDIKQVQITGVNGSEFIFVGLSDQTAASIKSFEAIDICWIEEAQVVTENSWTILLNTVFRQAGCEVWVSFNPELDTDPTWKLFVENPPEDTWRQEINWRDNPWFPPELNEKRLYDSRTRPKYDYDWIWEGKCRPAIAGAIYADEVAQLLIDRRAGDFPYDAAQPVYAVWDLGFSVMAIIICQRVVSQIRIIDYIEAKNTTYAKCSAELKQKPYGISELYLPHDGKAGNPHTGVSPELALRDLNWRVTVLPRTDPEDGIRNARMAFSRVYINRPKCERLIECLRRYSRIIPATTREPSNPKHDEFSHGADAFRYMVEASPQMGSMSESGGLKLPPLKFAHGL